MSKILTFDEILAAPDLEEKIVEVPEWGGAVKVRGLTKAAQQQIRKKCMANGEIDVDKFEAMLFAECMAEPKITLEQAEKLRNKSATVFDKVLKAIMEVSGISEEEQKKALKSFRPGV